MIRMLVKDNGSSVMAFFTAFLRKYPNLGKFLAHPVLQWLRTPKGIVIVKILAF